jgi:hypothetical protein
MSQTVVIATAPMGADNDSDRLGHDAGVDLLLIL